MNTYTALIPAYCPDESLIRLVNALKEKNFECVVVNDGSPASCGSVFADISEKAHVLKHDINKGKGAALRTGLKYIRDNLDECVIVTADADGQHRIEDIIRAADAAVYYGDCLVLGTRTFEKEEVPFKSYYGNKITESVFRFLTGVHVSDTQTGLRAFHSSLIEKMLIIPGDRYEYEINQLLAAVQMKIRIEEVRIAAIYENNNDGSHFHSFRDSFLIYRQLLAFGLASASSAVLDFLTYGILAYALHGRAGIIFANILAKLISSCFRCQITKPNDENNQEAFREYLLKYAASAAVALIISTEIIYFLTAGLHMNRLAAKLMAELVVCTFSRAAQRRSAMKQNEDQTLC